MNKSILKISGFLAVVGAVAFTSGCGPKKNSTTAWSDDFGVIDTGIPLEDPSNMGLPQNLNRELFQPVYFAYDSSQVNPEESGKCEQVADYLRKGKGKGVVVEGHADERGSREYNQSLGERRALAVRDYLISLGVDPGKIQTKSYGEEMPANTGHDETAWRENRRAVFGIY